MDACIPVMDIMDAQFTYHYDQPDGWIDDVCMLLCDEEMEFLPGAMMMTVAEISVS